MKYLRSSGTGRGWLEACACTGTAWVACTARCGLAPGTGTRAAGGCRWCGWCPGARGVTGCCAPAPPRSLCPRFGCTPPPCGPGMRGRCPSPARGSSGGATRRHSSFWGHQPPHQALAEEPTMISRHFSRWHSIRVRCVARGAASAPPPPAHAEAVSGGEGGGDH